MLKQKTYRSKKWLAAVGQIEQCVLCGSWVPKLLIVMSLKAWG